MRLGLPPRESSPKWPSCHTVRKRPTYLDVLLLLLLAGGCATSVRWAPELQSEKVRPDKARITVTLGFFPGTARHTALMQTTPGARAWSKQFIYTDEPPWPPLLPDIALLASRPAIALGTWAGGTERTLIVGQPGWKMGDT